ncbi:hypothetical protein D3OALGB2SA_854 [Olavius algarvensis associated proteobacterium Delta 3]|nr:hypothetical protein D3OALGB2SA_854 [Olavius algarvensis associated proteobacterium Delta 3]
MQHPITHTYPAQAMPLLFCLVLAVVSCGYGFTGTGAFPVNIQKLAVDNVQNRTAETGLENTVTSDLTYELTRSGKVRITSTSEAEGILSGTITALNEITISRSGTITANARRVQIFLTLTLEDNEGNILWTANDLTDFESYEVVNDPAVTEANQRNAIAILSRRLAERVVNRLTEDF